MCRRPYWLVLALLCCSLLLWPQAGYSVEQTERAALLRLRAIFERQRLELASLRTTLAETERLLSDLRASRQQQNESITALETSIATLRKQLDEKQKSLRRYQNELEQKEQRLAASTSSLERAQKSLKVYSEAQRTRLIKTGIVAGAGGLLAGLLAAIVGGALR